MDVEVANYNTSTNPNSPFVQRPIVVRKDATSVRRLLGREYSIERPGRSADQRRLTDDEFAKVLRSDFGLVLTEAEVSALVAALQRIPPTTIHRFWDCRRRAERSTAMSEMGQLAVIVASVRKDRIGPMVARWFLSRVQANTAAAVDVIDLADLDLPDDLGGGGDTEIFAKRIERADAIVVVTPEYNRGYPGALKTAIDSVLPEWRAKPIGFVSYGGISGGLRAVEQLRMIFAELHVVTVQAAVSLPHVWDQFDEHGNLRQPERPGRRRTPCYARLPGGAGRSARPRLSGPTTADHRRRYGRAGVRCVRSGQLPPWPPPPPAGVIAS